MNCPRCKHGALVLSAGFCCAHCRAGFLIPQAPAEAEPFVRELSKGSFSVRRRTGLGFGTVAAFTFIFTVVALFGYGAFAHLASLATRVFAALLIAVTPLLTLRMLRLELASVLVDTDDERLTIVEQFAGRATRAQISRIDIVGFWVRCDADDEGLTGEFELMTDVNGFQSRVLIRGVGKLEPLVLLAEKLGARWSLPTDTRGSDFA
jgi:hypothetical protein